ncbi:flavin monoamine oxidase family protein [Rugamonas brunnea]|uniref:flavin monoamine oxidase family protein n=1 Tax=Rugamonas brunnea TaxID=2758569 RepID=UPI001E5619AA|nr:FAD-dependent oxidoreductase [Rugamonas brunnea]
MIAAGASLGATLLSACGEDANAGDTAGNGGAGPAPSGAVIVIGAGMAGLAAARKLRDAGKDVIVLEARERVGGRILTSQKWSDAKVDLGATWIHGAGPDNPIAALASKTGARLAATSLDNDQLFDTDGTRLDSTARAPIDALQTSITAVLAAAQKADTDMSVQDAVRNGLGYANRPAAERNRIDFLVNTTIEHEYGGAADRLSSYWYDSGAAYSGGDALFLDGYHVLIDYLAQGLDVRLGQVVRQIAWSANGEATVTTNLGAFTAQRVIVTLPLGVLQSGAVTFSPALPVAKRAAIAQLGMGLLNKCCLRFPTAFWDTETDWLNYVPDGSHYGQWAEWVSLARPTGLPILLGFNAAAFGREIESWSDNEIIASAMATLRTMYGQAIPEPVDALITRWGADPYARGAYSCNVLGSTPGMRADLASNVNGRLFFAGEATESQYYQTVHGAYRSGLRAADEILAL